MKKEYIQPSVKATAIKFESVILADSLTPPVDNEGVGDAGDAKDESMDFDW